MKRRAFMSGIAALPIVATGRVAAQETCTCSCVKMEDREGVLIFEGAGGKVSETFDLESKRYRIEIEIENPSDYMSVYVLHEDASSEDEWRGMVYSDYDATPTTSITHRIEQAGKHFLQVETTSTAWKVGISPL